MIAKDFTPTVEQISLHGLGFIQVKLPANQRLHVWHPELPRRSCYEHSAIHNHRFSFESLVLVGTQINRVWIAERDDEGTHDIISHDGRRGDTGGRLSYVAGRASVACLHEEKIEAGSRYFMPKLQFHETPNSGVVVTLMTKVEEGTVHACSLITHGHIFDQGFNRFQLSADRLWQFVTDALRGAA
jgi:hypothetical protein